MNELILLATRKGDHRFFPYREVLPATTRRNLLLTSFWDSLEG